MGAKLKKPSKKIATIDCETDPFLEGRIPLPFIWGFYSAEHGQLFFYDVKDLMDFIADLSGYIIYAHNGGKFDFHYMLEFIQDWQKITVINNRLVAWRYGENEFRDSYAILPVGLAAYEKTKIDYSNFEKEKRDLPEIAPLIAEYLANDCKILFDLVTEFIENYGLHLTIASAAIKTLCKLEKLKIENSGREFYDTISPFYYGGRVQCFRKGLINEKVQIYDINSAYPRAMLEQHPIGNFFRAHDSAPHIAPHNFYKILAVSRGGLPFRQEDKTLSFPNDDILREYFCTGHELIAAHELGLLDIEEHLEQYYFPETKSFETFVNHFYTIKCTAKDKSPEKIFAKLMLNSSYGKFCAAAHRYRTFRVIPKSDFMNAISQDYFIHGEMLDKLIISRPNDEENHRFYNMATGASVTGWVRAFLLRSINKVENPIYCDTDSLVFTGGHNLEVGGDLGQWKHEGDFIKGGIGGKKLYTFINEKGEIKKASKGLTISHEEILRVCNGERIERTPDAPIFSIKKGKYFLKKTIAMT